VVADLKRTAEVDSATETQLLYALKEIAEISKDDDLALAAMERTVELEPSDTHTRFNLAYKHSEQGNNDLALLHYLRIPAQERGGATWNNLGVALNEFSLPAKSIEAYRQARDQGETLAMSNIARKFMFIGVLPEAKQLIDEAQKLGDYHQNVAQDVIKLRQIPEEEIKRQEEVITKAGPKGDFYKRFGRAASKPEPVSIAIDWIGPDGDLKISFDGKEFKAAGTYERPSPAYALGIFGDALQTSVKTERVRIEYSGRPRGRAIVGNVTREGSKPRSLLGDISNQTKFIMVLADGYSEIEVMEMPSGGDVKFYRLTAKATSSG
jgi:tetratricopeptide (TPR) repeat protein